MSIKYVEYLETDGSSYILIPKGTITYNNNIGIEVKYQYEDAENYMDVYVCGTSGNGLSNVIGVKQGMWSLNAYMYGQNFYHYIGNIDNAFVNYTSCPHTITMNKNNRLLDGNAFIYTEGVGATTYTNVDQSVFDALADSYFGVFCIGYGSDIPYYKALEKTRVYYVKIFNGDELQLYLKPCLDDSNIPCMYDEVSQTYYYNSGTGIFSHGDEVNNNLYLFANNNEGTAENLGSYRLYNMKIEGDSEGVKADEINYVDYLIGDGASYIDTGITPTLDMIFYGDYTLSGANHVAFGCMEFIRSFGIYQGAPRVYYGGLTSVASYYTLKEYNHRYQVTLSPDGYIVKDITSNINIEQPYLHTPNGSSNKTVKVFAEHTNAGVVNHTRGKIYEFKIWDTEGALIQHLRPCLDEEGIPCMYDEVSKQYFYNQGTGTFGYKKKLRDFQPVLDSNGVPCLMDKINKKYYYDKNGNGFRFEESYKPVSYIKGDGNSWIDIPIYTNPQYKYELVRQGSDVEYGIVFDAGNFTRLRMSGAYEFVLMYNNNTITYSYDFIKNADKHIMTIDKNNLYLNGELRITCNATNDTNSFSEGIRLFKSFNGRTDIFKVSIGKLYSFKTWNENDELVLDLIPVLDNNNTPCMYDKVSQQFFYNQGTGEFGYGIEEDECSKANYVEYLESNGSGYIDTKIIPKEDYTYEITCTSYSDSELFAYGISGNYNVGAILLRVGTKSLTNATNGGISYANWNALKQNEPNTIIMNANHCVLNGVEIATNSEGKQWIKPENGSLYLFGANRWNGTIGFSGKIYEFKITSDSEGIVAHFKPCLDEEGVPCMYDTVTETYFYNQGEGEFAYGKSIGYTPIKYIETNGTQYIDTGVVVNDNTYMDIDYRAVDKLHYIEDGLILCLDAIDNTRDGHNASSTVWEDLSGNGLDFDLTDVTVNDTTMTFNGTSSVGTLQDIELWRNIVNNTEQYTVELCFKFKTSSGSYQPIISTNLGNVNVARFVNSIQVGQQSIGTEIGEVENNAFLQRQLSTISCDANDITYHVNTKLRETLDNNDYIYPPTTDAFWIGARLTGAYYHFDGEICSIRIYNKKLTDEERLYNHSSDVTRYGVPTDVSVIDTNRNYLMNDFYIDTTYKYKEIDTTVEPNLTASEGATLTLGSTYMSYLSEEELEQATKNGWIIE